MDLKLEGKGLDELIAEVDSAFMDIPMGNTRFQIENFILNAALTPERKFRAIGLELKSKLREVTNIKFALTKLNIDIEELEYKLGREPDMFTQRRMQVDLEMKRTEIESTKKSIKDLVEELKIYYAWFSKLPRLTREDFEKGEVAYYKTHLHNQVVGLQGAHLSLMNMGFGINERGELIELKNAIEG